eukprot:CFRG3007T1
MPTQNEADTEVIHPLPNSPARRTTSKLINLKFGTVPYNLTTISEGSSSSVGVESTNNIVPPLEIEKERVVGSTGITTAHISSVVYNTAFQGKNITNRETRTQVRRKQSGLRCSKVLTDSKSPVDSGKVPDRATKRRLSRFRKKSLTGFLQKSNEFTVHRNSKLLRMHDNNKFSEEEAESVDDLNKACSTYENSIHPCSGVRRKSLTPLSSHEGTTLPFMSSPPIIRDWNPYSKCTSIREEIDNEPNDSENIVATSPISLKPASKVSYNSIMDQPAWTAKQIPPRFQKLASDTCHPTAIPRKISAKCTLSTISSLSHLLLRRGSIASVASTKSNDVELDFHDVCSGDECSTSPPINWAKNATVPMGSLSSLFSPKKGRRASVSSDSVSDCLSRKVSDKDVSVVLDAKLSDNTTNIADEHHEEHHGFGNHKGSVWKLLDRLHLRKT